MTPQREMFWKWLCIVSVAGLLVVGVLLIKHWLAPRQDTTQPYPNLIEPAGTPIYQNYDGKG